MAIALRRSPKGCIHHFDRSSQYCSHDYQKTLRNHGFKVSMSGRGNCYDNAVMETFFTTITLIECKHSTAAQRNAELIWRHSWQIRRAVEVAIFEYTNSFHTP